MVKLLPHVGPQYEVYHYYKPLTECLFFKLNNLIILKGVLNI